MKFLNFSFIPLLIIVFIYPILAEEAVIRGKVYDLNTHWEIPDVNIYVKGTQIGTTSDFAGLYMLRIPSPKPEMIIVFRHIAYDMKEILLDDVKSQPKIYLQPRVIPMRELEVEGLGKRPEIEKDLPQTMSIFESRDFEIRGYVDAADLLRSDHSIQVEEELSGKKTVTIRAGNPDDVVVLYNGVKMNSTYNNIFDLSLISLEDIDRFEIIKGSNTALYGSEAFSGIINIVPRVKQNYNVKFQQRFGTYNSGNWGLHLYQGFKGLHGSYSFKQGGARRRFLDDQLLENKSLHHTANVVYNFSNQPDNPQKNVLSVALIRSSLDYKDYRDDETLSNFNQVISLNYDGDLAGIKGLNLSVSNHGLYESQSLFSRFGTIDRNFQDRSFQLNAEKHLDFRSTDYLIKYQFERAALDFQDERALSAAQSFGLEKATLLRQRQGFVSIVKFHNPSGSEIIRVSDFDISFRHDRVIDTQQNPILRGGVVDSSITLFEENIWNETTFKISTHFSGGHKDILFNTYLNYGTNIKFPTLFQQISSPQSLTWSFFRPNLNPEKNTSLEIGMELIGDTQNQQAMYGFQFSGSLFRNDYENKFRISFPVGIPVAFYDNIPSAKLSGLEVQSSIFLFRKKVTLNLGFSRYFVSEKIAFPFKSDQKITSNLEIDHSGYSFQLHWFKEGEQVGWIRQPDGEFSEIFLPGYSNLDFHLSKTFEWRKLKLFANASARNILNRDVILQGLAIRDRRYYLTLGVQY